MRPVREQGVGRHRCPGTVRGACMQCSVRSGEGTEDRVAPGRKKEPPQRGDSGEWQQRAGSKDVLGLRRVAWWMEVALG